MHKRKNTYQVYCLSGEPRLPSRETCRRSINCSLNMKNMWLESQYFHKCKLSLICIWLHTSICGAACCTVPFLTLRTKLFSNRSCFSSSPPLHLASHFRHAPPCLTPQQTLLGIACYNEERDNRIRFNTHLICRQCETSSSFFPAFWVSRWSFQAPNMQYVKTYLLHKAVHVK